MKIKKVTALVLASVMALSLTACGGNKNETSEGGEAKEIKIPNVSCW